MHSLSSEEESNVSSESASQVSKPSVYSVVPFCCSTFLTGVAFTSRGVVSREEADEEEELLLERRFLGNSSVNRFKY